jgi:Survival protein SurE
LAAAKQAALLGVRGIAFSAAVSENQEPEFATLDPYVAKVIDMLLKEKTMSLVNVNFPEKPKGIRWTRQSVRHYDGKVAPSKDPMGRPIFWFTVIPLQGAEEGTDRWAVEHNWVSVTPILARLVRYKGTRSPGAAPTRKRTTKRANGDEITEALPEYTSAVRFPYPRKLELGAAGLLQRHPITGNFHLVNCRCEWRLDFDSVLVTEFVPAAHVPD